MIEREDQHALSTMVGPTGLLLAPADRLAYETAARYGGGSAAAVVRPADVAEVSAVIRHLVKRAIPFTPQSGFHRSEVMRFRRVAIAQLATTYPEYEVCDFGHIEDGGVHFNLLHQADARPDPAREKAVSRRAQENERAGQPFIPIDPLRRRRQGGG